MTHPPLFRLIRLPLAAAIALSFAGCLRSTIVAAVDSEVAALLATAAPGVVDLVAAEAPLVADAAELPSPVRRSAPLVAARPLPIAPLPLAEERSVIVKPLPSDQLAARPSEPPRIALQQVIDAQPARPSGELQNLQRIKPLNEISLDITPPRLVNDQQLPMAPPVDYAAEALPLLAAEQPFFRGDLVAAGYEWHPSPEGLAFCYQPLYFEEVNLERYGRSFGLAQPFVSAVAFYGRIPALPYMVFARPARRCTYHAHWTLPGYKIPQWEPQPLVPSAAGAAAEAAALFGIILLIP